MAGAAGLRARCRHRRRPREDARVRRTGALRSAPPWRCSLRRAKERSPRSALTIELLAFAGASPAAFKSDESNDRVKRDRHDERRRSRSMRKRSLRDVPVPAAKQDLRDAAAHSRDSPKVGLVRPTMGTGEGRGRAPRARIRPDTSARLPLRGAPAADDEQARSARLLLLDEEPPPAPRLMARSLASWTTSSSAGRCCPDARSPGQSECHSGPGPRARWSSNAVVRRSTGVTLASRRKE
jgi:hypothetical protein